MICPNCGSQNVDGNNFCTSCSAPLRDVNQATTAKARKPFYKKWWVWAIAVVVVIGAIGGTGNDNKEASLPLASPEQAATPSPTPTPTPTLSPEEQAALDAQEKANFISTCQSYTYEQVARDPDEYMLMPAHFKGEVSQIIEGNGFNVLMVNVTLGSYNLWSDTIYVQYTPPKGASRILENDIVNMYGSMFGLQTYTTVLGAERTIPAMMAYYIDLAN